MIRGEFVERALRNSAENETQHYWRLIEEIRLIRECPAADRELLAELVDELEVLRDMTELPTLRARCYALLAELGRDRDAS